MYTHMKPNKVSADSMFMVRSKTNRLTKSKKINEQTNKQTNNKNATRAYLASKGKYRTLVRDYLKTRENMCTQERFI
jgi:hypothetical protein